jgi:rhodanese-related sulfurtransferase
MNMTVNDLAIRLDRGDDLLVLDVRSPEEFIQDGARARGYIDSITWI